MSKVLLIYTGGTIGMIEDSKSKQLRPFDFKHLTKQIPELKKIDVELSAVSFDKPIDSSNMHPDVWVKLAKMIEKEYSKYDGFVVLHGSDTMAFTASALSFMLENLAKPVILTGSQLPIGIIRTDGKENLITAIEIAAAKENGKPIVPEVCIYFEYKLYRGNRTHKYNAEQFNAFQSPNYPELAEAGVHLKYNKQHIAKPGTGKLKVHTELNSNIAIIKLFPGITEPVVKAITELKSIKGIILETFGAGNSTTEKWFLDCLQAAIKRGVVVLDVTQCRAGAVELGKYETSAGLKKIGVVSGKDISIEAAVAKMMFLIGNKSKNIESELQKSLRGELS